MGIAHRELQLHEIATGLSAPVSVGEPARDSTPNLAPGDAASRVVAVARGVSASQAV